MKIEAENLGVRHPAARRGAPDALRGLRLTLDSGERVAVIGPSGAGKTSLLHALGVQLPPTQGQLRLNGQDPWVLAPKALQPLRRQLFIAPQTPPLPPRQRVVTAVLAGALPAWSLGRSLASLLYPREAGLAAAALARFELDSLLWQRVDRLSGGERQRVGLARALLSPARLWLVDEPLSALDPARGEQALRVLIAEATARGVTLVASLHHVSLALAHFPRVLGLRDGALQFDLPAAAITPAHLAALYAQREDELAHPVASPDPVAPSPVAMTCR